MFKKLIISCDEATTICDKNQYGEASIKELILLNLHFLHCKFCRKYTKQNALLTRLYKGQAATCKNLKHCMSVDDKDALKKAFEDAKG